MNVSAIIVTRGNVDMKPVIDSLPESWEKVIWNNGTGNVVRWSGPTGVESPTEHWEISDLAVYGRYAAIEYATHDLIYVQDDDVIISNPEAIVGVWEMGKNGAEFLNHPASQPIEGPFLVSHMPEEFRHEGYTDSCLVGFGAVFHRELPGEAFMKLYSAVTEGVIPAFETNWFERTCDVAFTTIIARHLLVGNIPRTTPEYATGPDRMYLQPEHVSERQRMLELARLVRDS